jgi:putative thioredoxin
MVSESRHVIDVEDDDFDVEVVERSHDRPVLVDFWAAWCGPCRMLAPVLEGLANEFAGAFVLAKLDTDANPRTAQRFRIQGIPAVKLFKGGQVVDEFVGAMPGATVRKFLQRHVEREVDANVRRAIERSGSGDRAGARALLEQVVAEQPGHAGAQIALARVAIAEGDDVAVERHLRAIDERAPEAELAEHVRAASALARRCRDAGGEAVCRARVEQNARDAVARVDLAGCLVAEGRLDEALAQLIEAVDVVRPRSGSDAHRAMLTVFGLLGPGSDLADDYKRRLQILL